MKQNVAILVLSAIALGGLLSCANPTVAPVPPASTTASNPQTLIKAGSGSSTANILRILKTAYETTTKPDQITLLEPAQSDGIIAGVKQGLVDVGFMAKVLAPKEQDGTFEYRELAHDALLVATHPSVTGVKNLTTADLKAIYSGSVTNWQQLGGPNQAIVLLDRPEDESAKKLLRKHYLGQDLPNARYAVLLRKEGELIQTMQSTPYSIGAFSLAYAIFHKVPVNQLSLNDVAPSPDTLKTGQYPMVRTISLVWRKNPPEATQSFVNYIFSQPGTRVLEAAGFAVITTSTNSNSK